MLPMHCPRYKIVNKYLRVYICVKIAFEYNCIYEKRITFYENYNTQYKYLV
jgi:hypothetical protein